MITREEREKDKAICEAATPGPWRWWTSNSHRRLRSDAAPGDVAFGTKLRDGCDDIVISDADMAASENAANRLPLYIADAEEMEKRIAKIKQWHKASTDSEHGDPDERAEEVLALVLKILRGEQ